MNTCFCALIAAVVVIIWQAHAIGVRDAQLATATRDLQALRSRAQATVEPSRPASPGRTSSSAAPAARMPEHERNVDDLIAALDSARRELAASQTKADQLTARVRALEDQQTAITASADQRVAATEARWKQSLDNASLTLEGVRSDLRAAKDEAAQLQAENQALKDAGASAERQAADASRLMAEYRDISRRRDTYLTSILQRYRDISRQYRSAAAVVASRRNDPSGTLIDEADFSRIQTALTSVQDDMRQIESLNAQAQLIERKLAGK